MSLHNSIPGGIFVNPQSCIPQKDLINLSSRKEMRKQIQKSQRRLACWRTNRNYLNFNFFKHSKHRQRINKFLHRKKKILLMRPDSTMIFLSNKCRLLMTTILLLSTCKIKNSCMLNRPKMFSHKLKGSWLLKCRLNQEGLLSIQDKGCSQDKNEMIE